MKKTQLKSAIGKTIRDTAKRVSRKQYNSELKESLSFAKKGNKIPHDALVKRLKK